MGREAPVKFSIRGSDLDCLLLRDKARLARVGQIDRSTVSVRAHRRIQKRVDPRSILYLLRAAEKLVEGLMGENAIREIS